MQNGKAYRKEIKGGGEATAMLLQRLKLRR
jgi:hypothetical protein